jgi:Ca-activated chloride channel family protein
MGGGGADDWGGDDDFGATPGGVKDMTLARDLIAHGQIPPPEALLVEAMFSEHDLGLSGAPCDTVLCLKAAAGVAPERDGADRGWLQIGMSSNIDGDTWVRPPTTFIFTVDVSGSMSWDYDEEDPTPGHLARILLHALADQLGPEDEVAIVTYGSTVATPLDITAGDQQATVHAAIDGLHEAGSTNMEAGMRRAYEIGAAARERGRGNVRVILFSDEQANVGATTASEFETLVAGGADDGIGITVLALGLGVSAELLQAMSHTRGANAFSMVSSDDAAQFVNTEYPWFTTPIAYDLSLAVSPSAGLAISDAYGFPGSFAQDPELTVSTIFLSKRKGALLVSLDPAGETELDTLAADIDLFYALPDGSTRTESLHAERGGAALDERGQWFAQPAIRVTTALALLVDGMHDAAAEYASNPELAETIMQTTRDRFVADADVAAEPQLDIEVALCEAMLQLIIDRAPQGSLYPG